jgi:phosphoenolpyruvate-protein kinase (PTS system EI component)
VAVPILIGLGVHELSMVPAVIPPLKALIATLNVEDCTTLATNALERETAEAVRALTEAIRFGPGRDRASPRVTT